MKRETLAVHGGREDLAELGVHAPPVDLSSTYPLPELDLAVEDLEGLAAGHDPKHTPLYARLYNPTTARWERGVQELEDGAEAAVAFASGMAAVHAILLALRLRDLQDGVSRNRIVAVRPLYGGTDHLLATGLMGFDVDWTDEAGVAAAVGPETALVLVETPANPTLDLVDLRAVVAAAGDVPVACDNTFATPVLQNPLTLGCAFSFHSATKFLGGHGDVLAGVVATSEAWAERLRSVRVLTGGVLHPWASFLLHRSLPTLPMRVERAQDNATELAARLLGHAAVERVLHPSLGGCDPRGLVGTQMRGPGAVLSFAVRDFERAAAVMRHLELIHAAVSLGSTDTLLQHPAGLTHRLVAEEAREATGIDPGLLRLSVGVEDVEDLWGDLARALDCAAAEHP